MAQRTNNTTWLRWVAILGFVLTWQGLVALFQPELVPSPIQVLQQLAVHIQNGELPKHLAITLQRVAISFFFALLVGFLIGMLMGWFQKVDILLDGLVTLALNIPALVTIILCFIWFGLNEFAAILAVVLNKIPIVIVTIREGVKARNTDLLQVSEVFQVGHWRNFTKVFLPQIYPYLLASIRTGLSLIWKIVLVVELIGCSDGVGFQLGIFFQFFDIASILAYTLAFVVVIFLIEAILVLPWERKITAWRYD